jgi:hypothetical protein
MPIEISEVRDDTILIRGRAIRATELESSSSVDGEDMGATLALRWDDKSSPVLLRMSDGRTQTVPGLFSSALESDFPINGRELLEAYLGFHRDIPTALDPVERALTKAIVSTIVLKYPDSALYIPSKSGADGDPLFLEFRVGDESKQLGIFTFEMEYDTAIRLFPANK